MGWFRTEEASGEQCVELLKEVIRTADTLSQAGVEVTPGVLEDVMNAKGIPVEVEALPNGPYLVRTVPQK